MKSVLTYLTQNNFSCWVDESSMEPGTENFPADVEEAISSSGCMIVILTPEAKQSGWVALEIAAARTHEVTIFPIMAAGDKKNAVPFLLGTTNWAADLREEANIENELQKLAASLLHHLKRSRYL
jgi:hypothetical protein